MAPLPTSAYIHIPFCESICPYCDFPKVLKGTGFEREYIASLILDIGELPEGHFRTLYIGGGTPSCLDFSLLGELLASLSGKLREGGEFTFEGNPESLDEERIDLLARFGVNRVSLGVQSSKENYLSYLGRGHDFDLVKERVTALKEAGIENINLDLMYGFDGQSESELLDDIEAILSLRPTHISTYSLLVEPNTVFFNKDVKPAGDDEQAVFYELICKRLKEAGFIHYEVSNFALPGFHSRHNMVYWRNERYIGLGAGASGYEGDIRYKITSSIPKFIKGERRSEEERVSKQDQRTYFLLTHLRLAEGFSLKEFNSLFDEDLLSTKKEEIASFVSSNLIEVEGDRLFVKEGAMFVEDIVIRGLI